MKTPSRTRSLARARVLRVPRPAFDELVAHDAAVLAGQAVVIRSGVIQPDYEKLRKNMKALERINPPGRNGREEVIHEARLCLGRIAPAGDVEAAERAFEWLIEHTFGVKRKGPEHHV